MSDSLNTPHFEEVIFRAGIREHGNCTFLGYADGTVVAGDLRLRIRNLQVKILNGNPRVDFPQEKGTNGIWYPIVFPKNAETRRALTESLFQSDPVFTLASIVLEDYDRAEAQRAS